jgi:hypothetical protein
MKRRFSFYFIMLVTIAALAFTSVSSQNIYASSENNPDDQQSDGDSSFSLPFGLDFADQSYDGDGDGDNSDGDDADDDLDIDELPFP